MEEAWRSPLVTTTLVKDLVGVVGTPQIVLATQHVTQRIATRIESPSAIRRFMSVWVRSSIRAHDTTMCNAVLACRFHSRLRRWQLVLPDTAGSTQAGVSGKTS